MTPRYKEKYQKEVLPALKEQFGFKSVMRVPRITKICLNQGLGKFGWQVKNEGMRLENADLYVKTIMVDGGRMLKRIRTAPQGRANRIRKRSNHVTLVIADRNTENNNNSDGQFVAAIHGLTVLLSRYPTRHLPDNTQYFFVNGREK